MSVSSLPRPEPGTRMTLDEFRTLNLPEESSLILLNGVVYDEDAPGGEMTKRNRSHARVELRIGRFLDEWIDSVGFRGSAFSGEVGCELPGHGFVGIDVAVFCEATLQNTSESKYVVGAPLLAVEILSPSNLQGAIDYKIDTYLTAGVGQVWIVNPEFRTVTIYESGADPRMYSKNMILEGGSFLVGFSKPIKSFFE